MKKHVAIFLCVALLISALSGLLISAGAADAPAIVKIADFEGDNLGVKVNYPNDGSVSAEAVSSPVYEGSKSAKLLLRYENSYSKITYAVGETISFAEGMQPKYLSFWMKSDVHAYLEIQLPDKNWNGDSFYLVEILEGEHMYNIDISDCAFAGIRGIILNNWAVGKSVTIPPQTPYSGNAYLDSVIITDTPRELSGADSSGPVSSGDASSPDSSSPDSSVPDSTARNIPLTGFEEGEALLTTGDPDGLAAVDTEHVFTGSRSMKLRAYEKDGSQHTGYKLDEGCLLPDGRVPRYLSFWCESETDFTVRIQLFDPHWGTDFDTTAEIRQGIQMVNVDISGCTYTSSIRGFYFRIKSSDQKPGASFDASFYVDAMLLTDTPRTLEDTDDPGDEVSGGVSGAPVIVADITDEAAYRSLSGDVRPDVAILTVGAALQVTAKDGTPITSAADALDFLAGRIVPAFSVSDAAAVTALTSLLNDRDIHDCFILSADPDLVDQARSACPRIHGAVVFGEEDVGTDAKRLQVRNVTNAHQSKVAVLPATASSDDILYLQKRLMSVWVRSGDDTVSLYGAMTAGANGVVTGNPAGARECLESFDPGTLLRQVLIIGHRGLPSAAQENSLASAMAAYEAGANAIECDVYLSKDGHIVILHNNTVDEATDGTGSIEDMTLAQIKALNIDQNKKLPTQKIPTLAEYFAAFKGKDIQHIIEIKSGQAAIIDKLKDLIDEYGVADQVSFISFTLSQLQRAREVMPEISAGYLAAPAADTAFEQISSLVTPYTLTYHPQYDSADKTQQFLLNLQPVMAARGMTFYPWTYYDRAQFRYAYENGFYGLTTDDAHWASDFAVQLVPPAVCTLSADPGQAKPFEIEVRTKTGTQTVAATPVVIGGTAQLVEQDGQYYGSASGTAVVLFKYAIRTSGLKYTLYSSPVRVEISGGTSSETESGASQPPVSGVDTGVPALSGLLPLLIASAGCAAVAAGRKRRHA